LRYTPFYKALKKIVDDGLVGEITNVSHTEGVGNVHISHSYVRGNWRKKEDAAPMILAKCSHDTDLLTWLIGKKCLSVSSIGSLKFFNEKAGDKE
jgi:predicted dehydrogenase